MDYKKLAQLLFPEIKHDISYYENMYKPRQVKGEVTRFAPSPTGFVHLGSLYGAFIDYLIAKRSGGVFYVRLEDTDNLREIKTARHVLMETLKEYDLMPDEGIISDTQEIGEYGPYVQSHRKEIYGAFAKHLVSIGKAFPCFCQKSNEEVKAKTKDFKDIGSQIIHDPCRDLTFEQIQAKINANQPFAIRLLSSGTNDKITVYDELKGSREIGDNTKDEVILKQDKIPPYPFAHVVDDHLMHTTLVVRGQEWFSSVNVHYEIAKAFGFTPFRYLHTGLICKVEDGKKRKLSKRKDPEADMRWYKTEGYPKRAVLEYLLTLINSKFEIWREQNPDMHFLEYPFDYTKISLADPIFDINKLNDISKNIISRLSAEQVFENVLIWAKEYNPTFANYLTNHQQYATSVFNIERQKDKPRKDIYKWSQVVDEYSYMWQDPVIDLSTLNLDKALICNIMHKYADAFPTYKSKDEWFSGVKEIAQQFNFATDNKLYKQNPDMYNGNVATLCGIIRYTLTGRQNTPDLYEICCVLTPSQISKRVNKLAK